MSEEEEKSDPPAGAPAWMATMADMMSLLLCFFVLLLSFANMDVVKFRVMLGSVKDAFGVQTDHPGDIRARSTSAIELSMRESTPYLDATNQPTRANSHVPHHVELQDRIEMAVAALGLDKVVEVEESRRGTVLRVKGEMLFDSGSTELRPESHVFLDEIARLAKVFPYAVAIEGHTDDQPIRTAAIPSNWHLSAFRAISTLRYIESTGGIADDRLSAGGYGSTRPLEANDTPEARAANRRVEFVFAR